MDNESEHQEGEAPGKGEGVMERAEAKSKGLKEYYTGRPCKYGHVAERKTANGTCVERWKEYYQENKQKIKARAKKYYWDNWEHAQKVSREYTDKNREKRLEYWRGYHFKNRDENLKKKREYRLKNVEYFRELRRMQYRENPEYFKARAKNSKASRKGAVGKFTVSDLEGKYELQGGKCYYCHSELGEDYQVDHKIPICSGGTNWPSNLCLTCAPCNLTKNRRGFWEFLESSKQQREEA